MRDFFKGVLKIGTAIVASMVVLGVIGGLIAWGVDAYKKREARPYEEVRQWESDLTDSLQLKMTGRTKLVDGMMFAEFNFMGYPDYLTSYMNRSNENSGFTVSFVDKDGFEIKSKKLKLSEGMTFTDKGKKLGMQYTYDEYMPVETYARFQRVQVAWHLNTDAPAPPPKIDFKPDEPDHCEPGLSRAERLKRLRKLGTIRQTGENEYIVGSHKLLWIAGDLFTCN